MRILSETGRFRAPADGNADYVEQFRVPSMSIGTYCLAVGAIDGQSPHREDEIYVVTAGRARFVSDDGEADVKPGDVIFVPAGEGHRFIDVTEALSLLVLFAPPESGA